MPPILEWLKFGESKIDVVGWFKWESKIDRDGTRGDGVAVAYDDVDAVRFRGVLKIHFKIFELFNRESANSRSAIYEFLN